MRFKSTRIANSEQNVIDKVYSEAKKIEFPWKEAAPDGSKSFQGRETWSRNLSYGL